jgi:hypothetical protein
MNEMTEFEQSVQDWENLTAKIVSFLHSPYEGVGEAVDREIAECALSSALVRLRMACNWQLLRIREHILTREAGELEGEHPFVN